VLLCAEGGTIARVAEQVERVVTATLEETPGAEVSGP
jgi:hypothetical protein